MRIYVLWENHATGSILQFGPHKLLLACVAERLGSDPYELARAALIGGRSCGGDGNVLRELGHPALWDSAPHLLAVLDSDKIHRRLGTEARSRVPEGGYAAWAARTEVACRERIRSNQHYNEAQLTICFLDRNLESLLEVIGGFSGKKELIERDKILQRAASDPGLARRALEAMPSWAGLVDAVASKLVL